MLFLVAASSYLQNDIKNIINIIMLPDVNVASLIVTFTLALSNGSQYHSALEVYLTIEWPKLRLFINC